MSSRSCRRYLLAVPALMCALLITPPVTAGTLDLISARWEGKAEITVLISAGRGVSDSAVADVMQAIDDWNLLLPANAPQMIPHVGKRRDADLIINIKPGGGPILGQTSLKTANPFDCALTQATILLSGRAFGQPFSTEGRLATARHEIGHVYGLGHSDDPNDLMFSSGDPFTTDEIPISDCDVAAIEFIYSLEDCSNIPEAFDCNGG